jgi:hypothetical protein
VGTDIDRIAEMDFRVGTAMAARATLAIGAVLKAPCVHANVFVVGIRADQRSRYHPMSRWVEVSYEEFSSDREMSSDVWLITTDIGETQ